MERQAEKNLKPINSEEIRLMEALEMEARDGISTGVREPLICMETRW